MRAAMIAGGILLLMVGLGFVFPQIAHFRDGDPVELIDVLLFCGGVVLSLLGVGIAGSGVTGKTPFTAAGNSSK